ncbi:PREDICTED: 5-hydroxytryptamine receptor 1D-like [Priapulus caudatus]|uniref:5-hydroxytryptamine receptor 1D-like n=1 Tax=Priapulus caudatus TaxID=37621 RepID=A0ABM1F1R5_PRICU|nr:PREDICTED: 5-hydroxytryptamine receptor 1D-like [Priapulus caudatus]
MSRTNSPPPPTVTVTVILVTDASSSGNGTTAAAAAASPPYELWASVVISVMLSVLILLTILGNVLVILAVLLVQKLRTPSNYLIVSLAVADLSVALLVMPFSLIYEVTGGWVLGDVMCDVWTSSDVLLCTSSILNLCMISVDRYFAITKPLQYALKRTPRRMVATIVLVWAVSALISIPPLFGWKEPQPPGQCVVSPNIWYQLYATVGAFYLPCAVMVFVYYKIYHAAKEIAEKEARSQRTMTMYKRQSMQRERWNGVAATTTTTTTTTVGDDDTSQHHPSMFRNSLTKFGPMIRDRLKLYHQREPQDRKDSDTSLTKERKAAKTLGIIMGTFIFCWLPFFILAVMGPVCGDRCNIPPPVYSFFLWLGYCNSLCNPIIYATFNRDFRHPFRELLCLRCRTMHERLRRELYDDTYGGVAVSSVKRPSADAGSCLRADTVIHYHSTGDTRVVVVDKLGSHQYDDDDVNHHHHHQHVDSPAHLLVDNCV